MNRTAALLALLLLSACGPIARAYTGVANPTRKEPPPQLAEKALKVGAMAPALLSNGVEARAFGPGAPSPWTVVLFFRGNWCPYCKAQLSELQAHLAEFKSRGAEIVAVSVDTPEKRDALIAKLELTYQLVSDVKRESIQAWGVHDEENDIAWPSLFIVGPNGQIAWRNLAETYTVRPLWSEVLAGIESASAK